MFKKEFGLFNIAKIRHNKGEGLGSVAGMALLIELWTVRSDRTQICGIPKQRVRGWNHYF